MATKMQKLEPLSSRLKGPTDGTTNRNPRTHTRYKLVNVRNILLRESLATAIVSWSQSQ